MAAASDQSKEMTAAEAAKLVVRVVTILGKDKKPTGETREVSVKASEVFSFLDKGDSVCVVTTDGKKLFGSKAAK